MPFFAPRERAALAWAEAVTEIAHGVSDEVYREAREQFSESELVELTMAVIAINGWNRLAVAFRLDVGSYQPSPKTSATEQSRLTAAPTTSDDVWAPPGARATFD